MLITHKVITQKLYNLCQSRCGAAPKCFDIDSLRHFLAKRQFLPSRFQHYLFREMQKTLAMYCTYRHPITCGPVAWVSSTRLASDLFDSKCFRRVLANAEVTSNNTLDYSRNYFFYIKIHDHEYIFTYIHTYILKYSFTLVLTPISNNKMQRVFASRHCHSWLKLTEKLTHKNKRELNTVHSERKMSNYTV